ncbi:MAG: HD domain-containing protein [Candidatus Methanomethylophilaceae archaeon]|nr:HD domain-containing protein [Candidatus Methanomethylophilaceae archaeon]
MYEGMDVIGLRGLIAERAAPFGEAGLARVVQAMDYAESKHAGQTRSSGEPYITHPMTVALILMDLGADCDTVVSGLLHDVVEDTDATVRDVSRMFGASVAYMVDAVTKPEDGSDPYLKLVGMSENEPRAITLKLADRLHNMSTISHKSPNKRVKKAQDTYHRYVPLAEHHGMTRVAQSLRELCLPYL